MTSDAQKRARDKYDSKLQRITVRFPDGTRERIEKVGYKSVNSFTVSAVMEKLEKEEKLLGKK